jgi:hypothetical protein
MVLFTFYLFFMALWIMLKSFKMSSHRILLFVFFYFISHMNYIIS